MKKIVVNNYSDINRLSLLGEVELLKSKGKTPYVFLEDDNGNYTVPSFNKEEWKTLRSYDYEIWDSPEKKKRLYCILREDLSQNCKYWEIGRDDPDLIEVVERLGDKASDDFSSLTVFEFDDENFKFSLESSEHGEWVELIPIIKEKRLKECKSVTEIMDYLKSLNLTIEEEKEVEQ